MELDWSEQSPHIRTLYHPWQPGDGYDEAEALDEISQRFQIKWHTRYQTGRVNNLVEIERPERTITWLTDPPRSFRM